VEAALLGPPARLSELAGEAQRRGDALLAEATVKDLLDRVGQAVTGRLTRRLDDTTMRS
jgi:hypothetical protein